MLKESFTPYGLPPSEPTFAELDAMGPYPRDPLLSLDEFDQVTDLRHQINPQTRAQLTEDETVIRVNDIMIEAPAWPPSNLKILMALTRVAMVSRVGENGPAVAALPGSADQEDAAQNRFVAPHIRDAILTAKLRIRRRNAQGEIITPLKFPKLMRATLIHTAEQGGITDEEYREGTPFRQERPGKAMLVNFGIHNPGGRKFSRYLGWGHPIYTSVDATPLFIAEAADYTQEQEPDFLAQPYTARDGREHPMGQFFDLAVTRLLADLDSSQEGFLEFMNLAPQGGMLNQAWADSAGAYVHASGEWANHNDGIAAVEVQGYAYDALMKAANMYRDKFDDPQTALHLQKRAAKLQRDFLDKFFITDGAGTYAAMGRDYNQDGHGRNLEVRHVNMGILLETGILDGQDPEIVAKRQAIIKTLFSANIITKYGLRTLAESEVAYRPGGDHVGQIWPHINEIVARGLIKNGCYGLAHYLRRANWLIYVESRATPEYIRGDSVTEVKDNPQEIVVFNREHNRTYMFEIPGQRGQAWANEAILAGKYDYSSLNGMRLPTSSTDGAISAFEDEILFALPAQ